jgi:hypothetical protein
MVAMSVEYTKPPALLADFPSKEYRLVEECCWVKRNSLADNQAITAYKLFISANLSATWK